MRNRRLGHEPGGVAHVGINAERGQQQVQQKHTGAGFHTQVVEEELVGHGNVGLASVHV